jgi:hypothetical protein
MALSDAQEFLERKEEEKGERAKHSGEGTGDSGKENLINSGKRENLNINGTLP